jgi:hypothetical protein
MEQRRQTDPCTFLYVSYHSRGRKRLMKSSPNTSCAASLLCFAQSSLRFDTVFVPPLVNGLI